MNTNGLIEKSRDVGLTWLNVAAQVHAWLFEQGYKGSFGSRKEMLVDRIGDLDSIFEKARFLLRNLPIWMMPSEFDWRSHDNYLKLLNPDNGNSLTGESGDSIGRGGRSTVYDLDEAAFIERPMKVDASLSNNTNVIFYTSSVNGIGNPFHNKRMTYPPECVFTFRWQEDPRKNEAWYADMKAKFDPVVVASEIDLDYGASIEGIFIPAEWVRAAVNLEIPARGDRRAGLDVARSGKNYNVFTPRHGCVVAMPQHWHEPNTTLTAYRARDLCIEMGLEYLNFDLNGVGGGVADTLALEDNLPFVAVGIDSASSPSDREWLGENRTSADKFVNKRAELWALVRDRFRKTYNYVHRVADYPVDELISIPNHPTLIAQLSTPLGKTGRGGKGLIESKEDMIKRGVGSPDFADSLVYTEETPTKINYLLFV
jgi:hypothetical protein